MMFRRFREWHRKRKHLKALDMQAKHFREQYEAECREMREKDELIYDIAGYLVEGGEIMGQKEMDRQHLIRRLKERHEKLNLFWSVGRIEQCRVIGKTLVALEEVIEYLEKGQGEL